MSEFEVLDATIETSEPGLAELLPIASGSTAADKDTPALNPVWVSSSALREALSGFSEPFRASEAMSSVLELSAT